MLTEIGYLEEKDLSEKSIKLYLESLKSSNLINI